MKRDPFIERAAEILKKVANSRKSQLKEHVDREAVRFKTNQKKYSESLELGRIFDDNAKEILRRVKQFRNR